MIGDSPNPRNADSGATSVQEAVWKPASTVTEDVMRNPLRLSVGSY